MYYSLILKYIYIFILFFTYYILQIFIFFIGDIVKNNTIFNENKNIIQFY